MTKKEIARFVHENTDLTLADSQAAVQGTFEAISKLLLKHGRVELRGFGVFTVQTRAARKAHNPRTGEEVFVEEHDTVTFKPSKLMKADVQAAREAKEAKKAKREARKAEKAAAAAAAAAGAAPAKKASRKSK